VDVGLCSRVLLDSMDGLKGHHLFTDNYYTSPELYLELYKRGNNCCTYNQMRFPRRTNKTKTTKTGQGGTMNTLVMDHCLQLLGMTGDRDPKQAEGNVPSAKYR